MADAASTLRIDKLLWYLRFAKSRSIAQAQCEAGLIRLNGRRIERAHIMVRAGDILTLPWRGAARVVRIGALPVRRGPPAEAQICYEEMPSDASG